MNRKPIFDAVRELLGRGFSRDEVTSIDTAIDRACADRADIEASASGQGTIPSLRKLGIDGTSLIKQWEGCAKARPDGRFEAYPDPGSKDGTPWTIGWGSTGPDIRKGTVWTRAECDDRFERDLMAYIAEVNRAIGDAPTSQNQFDALVSFHYNTGQIARATLTKKHVAGDFAAAAREFGRWINNNGKPMAGLVRRRAAEATLYAAV